MATTLQMIEAVVQRLKAKFPALAVEYFPDKPDEYRLNHPKGALLVSYSGGKFGESIDVTYIAQPRDVEITITVVMRQLNGRGGAVDVLDLVRTALLGFRMPDCRKMRATDEKFLGETAGLWQYVVDFSAEAMLVEDAEGDGGPLLTTVNYEEAS
ncbi:MAG: hypothetical protein H6R04_705 [Burkholderiaceae bacterium]|nr:hypothetical protein [Burkholderiaceae bacterium]